MDKEIKETLEKQLLLLSERSKESMSDKDLADLTLSLIHI